MGYHEAGTPEGASTMNPTDIRRLDARHPARQEIGSVGSELVLGAWVEAMCEPDHIIRASILRSCLGAVGSPGTELEFAL